MLVTLNRAGVYRNALDESALQSVHIGCSDAFPPFADLVHFMERIAFGPLPVRMSIDEEGTEKDLIAETTEGMPDVIRFTIMDPSGAPGERIFIQGHVKRSEIVFDFLSSFVWFLQSGNGPDTWEKYAEDPLSLSLTRLKQYAECWLPWEGSPHVTLPNIRLDVEADEDVRDTVESASSVVKDERRYLPWERVPTIEEDKKKERVEAEQSSFRMLRVLSKKEWVPITEQDRQREERLAHAVSWTELYDALRSFGFLKHPKKATLLPVGYVISEIESFRGLNMREGFARLLSDIPNDYHLREQIIRLAEHSSLKGERPWTSIILAAGLPDEALSEDEGLFRTILSFVSESGAEGTSNADMKKHFPSTYSSSGTFSSALYELEQEGFIEYRDAKWFARQKD